MGRGLPGRGQDGPLCWETRPLTQGRQLAVGARGEQRFQDQGLAWDQQPVFQSEKPQERKGKKLGV